MSSNTTHPVNNQPTKDYPQPGSKPVPTTERRASFLSTLFSMPSPPVGRHNSVSSSSTASSLSPSSSSCSSMATPQHEAGRGTLTGSPASSLASPIDSKFSPIEWSYANESPHSRQTSLSDSLGGFSLASSFRWPGSASSTAPAAAAASNVQPISIPNSSSSALPQPNDAHHHPNPAPTVGMSAPTRRTSVGGPAFRRAFELPTYTSTYTNLQDNPPQQHDSPAQADANSRRGRSGSLFSSFGVGAGAGDASKRAPGPPRRKLSPMGERMIRDHPF
ncbi:hypothetical protein PGT21_013472 [Puccinia graminis f. sp. tritici]|uniref:Uncharacterized protein n=2 Tax=Puccinia graminis f. sp. tritici TaxID=56615 RepID=E3KRZ4_PUCGT|nr:uncharacterized protein PGTG_13288 [Puccinia graminis f. sp. tritici CRL 75-36-700-3]EFP87069.1 hypothetical protein PGTG_13288 [Puccinia graminis f. sp. tritici CRL 75-36-700-3]KAA1076620.1 hypothetical protein PGT21_013472 [Puccinia graminis f. sp. tritici]KAA1126786.1 hypothetical protein PGTUg99_020278 [Puccinia graminis f. sp. tritici]